MDDDDRGWPLGEAAIRAKYYALVKRDLERKMPKAKAKNLVYDQMLQQIPVTLPKSRSTRGAYSRAQSLQRVLRRAGLTDTSGKGSQSAPLSSPSLLEQNSGAPSHLSRVKNGVVSPVDREDVLALAVEVPKSIRVATPMVNASSGTRSHGKQTKFLAKQFKLISNNSNTAPRRNIKILGKAASPSDEASFAACGAKVIFVAEKIERYQLQERIRVHDCDISNPSAIKSVAWNLTAEEQSSSLRLDSLSMSPGPVMSRTTMTPPSGRYTEHAHANSPSSVISGVVSEASIPETVLSSPENELSGRRSKLTSRKTSFSNTRERWTSREIFGSFDFGGELDIAGTVAEGRNGRYAKHGEIPDPESSSWSFDGSMNSPSSGMRSPRQSSASSQGGTTDHDHHNRGRVEHIGVHTRRMKVTSPSSLFRDGPWYNGDDHRKPCREQSSPTIPRKLSRKLSTSFNKRRKQAMQVQPHPRDENQHAGLSTRSPDKKVFNEKSTRNVTVGGNKESFKGNLTLEISGLLSGFKVSQVPSRISKAPGNGRVSNGVISQQEATTAFQDDIAQLMLDRSESNEIGDIEEFLDGYMRLRSPFYLEVVEEFFRTVSYDCYKKPLDVKKLPPKVTHH